MIWEQYNIIHAMTGQSKSGLYTSIKYLLILMGSGAMLVCCYFTFIGISTLAVSKARVTESQCTDRCDLPNNWRSIPYERVNRLQNVWGSFNPGLYFSLKTATEKYSLASGLMWTTDIVRNTNAPRHDTHEDIRFEWDIHDGRNFGLENIFDPAYAVAMNGSFVLFDSAAGKTSLGGSKPSWIQQFDIVPLNKERKSWLWYFGIECHSSAVTQQCLEDSGMSRVLLVPLSFVNGYSVVGNSKQSGWFILTVFGESAPSAVSTNSTESESESVFSLSFTGLSQLHTSQGINRIKRDLEFLRSGSTRRPRTSGGELIFDSFGDFNNQFEDDTSFVAFHASFDTQASLNVALFEHIEGVSSVEELVAIVEGLESEQQTALVSSLRQDYSDLAAKYTQDFHQRFDSVFSAIGDSSVVTALDAAPVAQKALSSVLGGIAFLYGSPRIGAAMGTTGPSDAAPLTPEEQQKLHTGAQRNQNVALLTGTPSRTVFPRGFLWDEGFHEMLISEWDPTITMQVLSDWLHAMHFPALTEQAPHRTKSECEGRAECVGGWIPREMILGEEALRRVPEEFVTQRVNIANPPTFLLVVEKLLNRHAAAAKGEGVCSAAATTATAESIEGQSCTASGDSPSLQVMKFLSEVYPLLHKWSRWFLLSQSGSETVPGSFRWRGRSLSDQKVLPNTLASGLDDYPRSPLPSAEEHHVDLHCWAMTVCQVMARLERELNQSPYPLSEEQQQIAAVAKYDEQYHYLRSRLDPLHWSDPLKGYYDVGLSGPDDKATFVLEVFFKCGGNPNDPSSSVEISVPVDVVRSGSTSFCPESHPKPLFPLGDGNGGYKLRERYALNAEADEVVQRHIPRVGYVSIFPLLLKHVDPHSAQFPALLDVIEDPNGLWTDFGLRSIAKVDKFYLKRNSPGDAPYWRGPIWININYLALSALHHYSNLDASANPHLERVKLLYSRLRDNVQRTVLSQYQETGYFWEQYDDVSGKGIRGHPFTGWTALIVNIMAELY